QAERSRSDIDVFVIGDASFVEVVKALAATAVSLSRDINPVVMTASALREKIAARDSFVMRLISDPKVFVKGSDDELRKLAEDAPGRRARTQRRRKPAAAKGRRP